MTKLSFLKSDFVSSAVGFYKEFSDRGTAYLVSSILFFVDLVKLLSLHQTIFYPL